MLIQGDKLYLAFPFNKDSLFCPTNKLRLTGRYWFIYSSIGWMNTMHMCWYEAKLSNLQLKTQSNQLLGSLPSVIVLSADTLQAGPNTINLFSAYLILQRKKLEFSPLLSTSLLGCKGMPEIKLKPGSAEANAGDLKLVWAEFSTISKAVTMTCKYSSMWTHAHVYSWKLGKWSVL